MPITFDTLKSFMPSIGLENYDATEKSDKEGRIVAGFTLEFDEPDYKKANFGVLISLEEAGEFLQIRIFKIIDSSINALESKHLLGFLKHILKINYNNKIGRWCFDPEDGDCYIDWGIGIEDNSTLTKKQVMRMMGSLVATLRSSYAPVNRILNSGSAERPKDKWGLIASIGSMLDSLSGKVDSSISAKILHLDTDKLIEIENLLKDKKITEAINAITGQ